MRGTTFLWFTWATRLAWTPEYLLIVSKAGERRKWAEGCGTAAPGCAVYVGMIGILCTSRAIWTAQWAQ